MIEEEKEEGLSIGELIHVVFIKKWLLLGITVFIMLIGVLFVQGIYNPNSIIYQCEYELKFPGSNSGKYPDGKEIIYNDFVSIDNLEKVQQSNEDYSNVNVHNIANQNGISIERAINKNESTNEVNNIRYRISVKKKYFKSDDQARNFIVDLVKLPIQYALEVNKDINYKENILKAIEADDYLSQINYLIAQKDMILSDYMTLISEYSNGFKLNDKTLSTAQLELASYFSKNDLEALKKEVINNGYVKEENYKYTILQEKINLQKEYAANDLKITSLKLEVEDFINKYQESQSIQLDQALAVYQNAIADLVSMNSGILSKINNEYNVYLGYAPQEVKHENGAVVWSPEVSISNEAKVKSEAAFKEKINTITNDLEKFSDTYTEFVHAINETYSYVIYYNGSKITKTGGMNLLLAIIISLFIGFVVGCCINLALDLPKYCKNKKNGTLNNNDSVSKEENLIEEKKE